MSNAGPSETTSYLAALPGGLRELLGVDLVGVYLGGSLALGGYDPARSDVDVAVVCRGPVSDRTKREIAAALRHDSLPCPARGLELVVYPESTVRRATRDAGYVLNLNTGRSMPFHVSDGALAADALAGCEGSGEGHEESRVRRFLETARISLEQQPATAGPARSA